MIEEVSPQRPRGRFSVLAGEVLGARRASALAHRRSGGAAHHSARFERDSRAMSASSASPGGKRNLETLNRAGILAKPVAELRRVRRKSGALSVMSGGEFGFSSANRVAPRRGRISGRVRVQEDVIARAREVARRKSFDFAPRDRTTQQCLARRGMAVTLETVSPRAKFHRLPRQTPAQRGLH